MAINSNPWTSDAKYRAEQSAERTIDGVLRVILYLVMLPPGTRSPLFRNALSGRTRLTRSTGAFALVPLCLMLMLPIGCANLGLSRAQSPAASSGRASLSLASAPEWALASTRRDDQSVIGIGSGRSLDEATRYALQDVASRLSVTVKSELRDIYREISGTSTESLEHVIETKVLGTRFNGWERTRSLEIERVFWVEVRIDRRRLARDNLRELSELADGVDRRLASAQGSALTRWVALQSTEADQERISNLITLTDVLDPTLSRANWAQRSARWRDLKESVRRALIFEVRSDSASHEIARWLEAELASRRYSTRQGGCSNPDAICIDVRSEIAEANVASRHVAKIRSYFSILEPGGSTLREVDLSGRGNSSSDPDRARRKALDDLRHNFHAINLLGGLITGP